MASRESRASRVIRISLRFMWDSARLAGGAQLAASHSLAQAERKRNDNVRHPSADELACKTFHLDPSRLPVHTCSAMKGSPMKSAVRFPALMIGTLMLLGSEAQAGLFTKIPSNHS